MIKFIGVVFTIVLMATTIPVFADDILDLTDNNTVNNDSNVNDSFTNNSSNNTNSNLTTEQLQILTSNQVRLTVLIEKIDTLTTTYKTNSKAKGILNALAQFRKQAVKLNQTINNYINGTKITELSSQEGLINSFTVRTASLENKVAVKERLLAKLKTNSTTNSKKEIKNKIQKQIKANNKNKKG